MTNEIQVWNKVLTSAMQMPGVKVDRDAFLAEKLYPYSTSDQLSTAIEKGPIGVISIDVLDTIAQECISRHTWLVTSSSAALGIPGGFAMLGTVPGDVAQYYYHVFVLAQKLAYIYGYPDLCDEHGNFTESASSLLTVFVGIMSGVGVANKVIQELAEQFQKEVIRRLPRYALTKTFFYPIIKQIAKWIGISLTKQSFAKGVSKFVPILGGIVSGGLTYKTFKPQSKKLMFKLRNTMLLEKKKKKKEYLNNSDDDSQKS